MIFFSLLIVVFLSPLPYATNRPWSWSLWALLIAILSICWCIHTLIKQLPVDSYNRIKSIKSPAFVFFLIVLWVFIQITSIIPADWEHPLWNMTENILQTQVNASISLNKADSITAIMRLLSYALVFWLSFYYCHDRNKAKIILSGLMISGFVYSIYGLIIHLGGFKTILWQQNWPRSSLTSTFVNRNHFATYAGLTLLCSLALLSDGIQSSSKYKLGGYLGWQRFLENLINRNWFPLLAFITIGTALILTYSRGGFLSTLLAIVTLFAAFNLNSRTRNIHVLTIVSVFVLVGGAIFYISGEILVDRFDYWTDASAYRGRVFELTWNAIKDNPWLGYGYGAYQEAFPLYKTMDIAGSIRSPLLWDYAHNSYLETIFELGFPAAILLFYCFYRLAWICFKGLMLRKRDLIYPATGLAATFLIAGHALVDFSMQIPAVAYTYALLMGAACAQSFSSRQR